MQKLATGGAAAGGGAPATADRGPGARLITAGVLLFLIGLLTGFVLPLMRNPRMGLSSHLEAVMNGMFLVLLGLIWDRLALSRRTAAWVSGLALFGAYANWATTLFAGFAGAGSGMMPIAGLGHEGTPWQEALIGLGLVSLSLAMVAASGLVLAGLLRRRAVAAGG